MLTKIFSPDWRLGFVSQEEQYVTPTALVPLAGALPKDLNGTLFRNGPGRFDVYGERLSHWFDGDGKIAKIDIRAGTATYQSRFVNTRRKQHEDNARKRLYPGFANTPRGSVWGRLLGWGDMNVANTNVISHSGKLLALQESGLPYRLDPDTLITKGLDDLQGLPPGTSYTAHPKPHNGGMWGFGVQYGLRNMVRTYFTDSAGKTTPGAAWDMPFPGLIHDFCLTKTRAVFVIPPWTMDRFPWRFLCGLQAMDKMLKWMPELQTRVITIDLMTGTVTHARTTPALLFHTVNAWDTDDGGIILDACCMADAAGLQVAIDVMQDKAPERHMPTIRRLHLDSRGEVQSNLPLFETPMDFPRISSSARALPHRHVWGIAWSDGTDFFGQPVHMDLQSGTLDAAPMSQGEYASECALAPKPNAQHEDDAYLVTVVLNAPANHSELRIYDANNLGADALCRQKLPQIIPHGFHGNWLAREAKSAIV